MTHRRLVLPKPILALVGGVGLFPSAVLAYDVQVDAEIIGQGYQLRAADSSIVDRRRLTSYLGLSLWNLGPKDSDGLPSQRNQFSATLSMRFDVDLGNYLCNLGRPTFGGPLSCQSTAGDGTTGPLGADTYPELGNLRPELLFAYIEGKNLGGLVNLRLGRQVQMEGFDVRGLDGAHLEVHTPVYMAAELWGGLNVNGYLPIDSPIYSLDGTSHTAQNYAAQPTVGAAIRSYGFRDIQARLSYRRSFSGTRDANAPGCPKDASGKPTACAPDGMGTIEERVGYTVRGRLLDGRIYGWGGLRYDILNGRFDEGNAGARVYLTPLHSLSVEYLHNAPTWDGDSIFNIFSSAPLNDLRLLYDGRKGDFRFVGRVFGRYFQDESQGIKGLVTPWAFGATAGARYDRRLGFVRLDGYFDGGYGGTRAGADLAGRLSLWKNQIGLEGRLTYMFWEDSGREENTTHSVGMQLGARYAITQGIHLHILAENNINRFYNSQLRLLALLDLSYYLAPKAQGAATPGLPSMGFGSFGMGRAL